MSQTHETYIPTEEEVDMINSILSDLRDIGDFQVQFIELLSDQYSTIVISVKPPESFNRAGDEMTCVHAAAQDVSDEFSRNLVVTTTNYSEGGRKIRYDEDTFGHFDNVVQLNPNKQEVELPRSAAARPGNKVSTSQSMLIFLEEACGAAENFLHRGFKSESEALTSKLAETVSILITRNKLSLVDDEVSAICSDIAHLFFELGKVQDARNFLESCGTDSAAADKQLEIYSRRKAELQSTDRSFVLKELDQLLARLAKFTDQ